MVYTRFMGKQQESLFERLTFFSGSVKILRSSVKFSLFWPHHLKRERRRPTGCLHHNVTTVYFPGWQLAAPSKQGLVVCSKNSNQAPKSSFGPRSKIFQCKSNVLFRQSLSQQLWSAHHRVFSPASAHCPLSTRQTHLDTFMFLGRTFFPGPR